MRNYEERAKDFIKEVYPFIEGRLTPYWVKKEISVYNSCNKRRVRVGHGLARIALITSDYVVKWDYDEEAVNEIGGCENEIALYARAEADGFAYLFAKITRYEYKGRKFYIMPRVDHIGEYECEYADEFMTEKEKEWCEEHDLTDLHCNNYGFRKGRVCIVDYACRCSWGGESD